jgi:transaldolase
MKTVSDLKVAIFADGAERAGMLEMYARPYIKGFTTNPTLMRKAGVTDYEKFARNIVQEIPDRPISFEVFADDFAEMARQARKIATWGQNIRVKIPITNTRRESAVPLCERLTQEGIPLNVTALFTLEQVQAVVDAVKRGPQLMCRFSPAASPIPASTPCR